MIKPRFSSCDYANDFEAIIDAHEVFDWLPRYSYNLWLKGYDTSCRETEREVMLNDNGYEYDCYVYVLNAEDGTPFNFEMEFYKAAKTRQDAEKVLCEMADGMANDSDAVDYLKALVG